MAVFNSHMAATFAGKQGFPDVWISKRGPEYGRAGMPPRWLVVSPNHKTDPSDWNSGYAKTFVMCARNDPKALQKAMDWAKEQYGVEEWVKIPGFGGDYFPKEAAKAITAERKRRLADN